MCNPAISPSPGQALGRVGDAGGAVRRTRPGDRSQRFLLRKCAERTSPLAERASRVGGSAQRPTHPLWA